MNAEQVMLAVANALEQAGIPSMLVGAFASNYYGIPRSTQDADFLLQVPDLSIANLAQSLGPAFHVDPQSHVESFTWSTYYTITHRDSDFTFDLFILRDVPHDQAAFSRRLRADFGGACVYVPTAEDVIVSKLYWSQGGRRSKDLNDASGVLAVQTPAKLDLAYIRRWTREQNTLDLFEKLLADIVGG